MLTSATPAPLTAVLLLLEITAAPAFALPLVVAVAFSALLSRALSGCSVYTRKPRH